MVVGRPFPMMMMLLQLFLPLHHHPPLSIPSPASTSFLRKGSTTYRHHFGNLLSPLLLGSLFLFLFFLCGRWLLFSSSVSQSWRGDCIAILMPRLQVLYHKVPECGHCPSADLIDEHQRFPCASFGLEGAATDLPEELP